MAHPHSSATSVPHLLWALSTLNLGGTEMFTVQVIPRLMKRLRVTVLLTEGRGELYDELASTGVRIVEAPLQGKFHRGRIARASALIRELAPDIVHTHSLSTHYLIRIASILSGVPVILPHLHGMVEAAFRHGLDQRERRLLPSTDRVLFVSGAARADFERLVLKGDSRASRLRERLEVVHDGIDNSAYSAPCAAEVETLRKAYALPQGAPVIGKIGRLHPVKNLELLIDVVALLRVRFPAIRCLLVGDGQPEYRAQLEELCRSRGVEANVIFTGYRRDIAAHLALLDVSLLTSHSEGLPRAVLEALAAGTPVVASQIPGMEEIVEEGVSGYLAPPDSPGIFADRVGDLLENPERRAAFSREGRLRAAQYDLDAYAGRLVELYQRTAREQPAAVRRARALFRARYRILRRI